MHHEEAVVLPLGTPSYLQRSKGWVYRKNGILHGCLFGRKSLGNVAKSNSRIEIYENIESKVRRDHEKFQAGRQSFDA